MILDLKKTQDNTIKIEDKIKRPGQWTSTIEYSRTQNIQEVNHHILLKNVFSQNSSKA